MLYHELDFNGKSLHSDTFSAVHENIPFTEYINIFLSENALFQYWLQDLHSGKWYGGQNVNNCSQGNQTISKYGNM